jgi:hypothetical protein
MKQIALALAILAAACGAPVQSDLGYCYHLSSDEGVITLFRPCEDQDADVCVTRLLDGQEPHGYATLTDCRSCLAGETTLSGAGLTVTVEGDDVDYVCARYDQ